MKAGQMELVRLIEQNRRPAVAYEPYITAQLGQPLYSRLHEKTQRAIQLSEYLYNINQEARWVFPDRHDDGTGV